jgi:hypothetical protein
MKLRRLLVATTVAGAMVLAVAGPAAAGRTGGSTATLTVTAGTLSITVSATPASLGSLPNSLTGGSVSGALGAVQVSDTRTGAAGSGWVASAISTAFAPPSGAAIPASAVGYTAGQIVKVGTATYTANDPVNLAGIAPVVTATEITGDNSATWTPTIHVAVPAGMAANTYTATITYSVV